MSIYSLAQYTQSLEAVEVGDAVKNRNKAITVQIDDHTKQINICKADLTQARYLQDVISKIRETMKMPCFNGTTAQTDLIDSAKLLTQSIKKLKTKNHLSKAKSALEKTENKLRTFSYTQYTIACRYVDTHKAAHNAGK